MRNVSPPQIFRQPGTYNGRDRRFSGETEEEFAESKAFVDKVDFYETHIFKYSRREGTKAAAMKDQVPDQIKAQEAPKLLELNRKSRRFMKKDCLEPHRRS